MQCSTLLKFCETKIIKTKTVTCISATELSHMVLHPTYWRITIIVSVTYHRKSRCFEYKNFITIYQPTLITQSSQNITDLNMNLSSKYSKTFTLFFRNF